MWGEGLGSGAGGGDWPGTMGREGRRRGRKYSKYFMLCLELLRTVTL